MKKGEIKKYKERKLDIKIKCYDIVSEINNKKQVLSEEEMKYKQ